MSRKDITKLFKRFFITFFCCLPVFLVVGFLLEDKINDWILTFMFIVICGGIFAIEELIHYKRKQKREMLKQQLKNRPAFEQEQTLKSKTKKQKTKSENLNKNSTKNTNKLSDNNTKNDKNESQKSKLTQDKKIKKK